jgi:hypothetical protein
LLITFHISCYVHEMAGSLRDDEKDVPYENGTIRTESTMYSSDPEKAERGGEPDTDHEAVEEMDNGHMEDLEREHVGLACVEGLRIMNSS